MQLINKCTMLTFERLCERTPSGLLFLGVAALALYDVYTFFTGL